MLDRLQSIAIPRIRDFRGLNPRSFDGRGNYSMGIREQIIFPEVDYDSIDQVRGLDVTITTTAADRRGGVELLSDAGHAVPREEPPPTRGAAPAPARRKLEAGEPSRSPEEPARRPQKRREAEEQRGCSARADPRGAAGETGGAGGEAQERPSAAEQPNRRRHGTAEE